MSYRILEERFFDSEGNHVPPSAFYVVDETGKKVSQRRDTLEEAVGDLRSLEAEKKRTKDNGFGR